MNFCSQPPSKLSVTLPLIFLIASLAGCGSGNSISQDQGETNATQTDGKLSGDIAIDGSSTVFPITEAMAKEFQKSNPNVRVNLGESGTGGGFKKFCAGETDISDASRPIKKSEIEACQKGEIEYIELPIAFDALSVIVNQKNNWAACLTTAELKKIWEPGAQGKIKSWKQVRADFPDKPLTLYGAGTDSGTFDYFTDAINGKEGASREDYTASEDDNVIVQGIAKDENALGYFGLAYLEKNIGKLKAVKIDDQEADNGEGCIEPGFASVEEGTYQPLARPIFIYVKKTALARPEIKAFVDFYLQKDHGALVKQVGYIPLPSAVYEKSQARLSNQKTGTAFGGGSTVGVKLKEVF